MSTIACVGSAPEPSSAPERTWPAVWPATAPGVPVDEVVARLARVLQQHDVEPARVDLAVGADRDRRLSRPSTGSPVAVDEAALGVGGELAVARVARALVGLDGEEAVAVDGEVERLARVLERLGREVGDGAGDLDGGRLACRSSPPVTELVSSSEPNDCCVVRSAL